MTKVIYYTTLEGKSPVEEFILTVSSTQRAKVIRVLTYVEEYGLVTAIRHIRKLTGTSLWEIRILGQDSIRVLYATVKEDAIFVLHGFIKKSQKTPVKELNIAINRLEEWKKRPKRD